MKVESLYVQTVIIVKWEGGYDAPLGLLQSCLSSHETFLFSALAQFGYPYDNFTLSSQNAWCYYIFAFHKIPVHCSHQDDDDDSGLPWSKWLSNQNDYKNKRWFTCSPQLLLLHHLFPVQSTDSLYFLIGSGIAERKSGNKWWYFLVQNGWWVSITVCPLTSPWRNGVDTLYEFSLEWCRRISHTVIENLWNCYFSPVFTRFPE